MSESRTEDKKRRRVRPSIALGSALVLAALSLAGCASGPGSGPSTTAITDKSAASDEKVDGYALIDVDAGNIADYRVGRVADRPEKGRAQTQAQVRLAPGDMMRVVISESKEGGLFAQLASGGTSFPAVRVDESGTITLPYVERLSVRGLDPHGVEERIRARLKGLAFEPQVYVELLSNRNNSVLVTGDVHTPGRQSMLDGPMTVVDAVARAGGPNHSALHTDVILRRGATVRRVSMASVQNGGNFTLRAGDTLTLDYRVRNFNALGALKKTGQFEFQTANPSVMDALAQLGGLFDDAANPTGVFLFRMNESRAYRDANGAWQAGCAVFRFDMSKPETLFLLQAFALKPDDTIYVTNAPAYEWMKTIKPLATTMIAMRSAIGIADTASTLGN